MNLHSILPNNFCRIKFNSTGTFSHSFIFSLEVPFHSNFLPFWKCRNLMAMLSNMKFWLAFLLLPLFQINFLKKNFHRKFTENSKDRAQKMTVPLDKKSISCKFSSTLNRRMFAFQVSLFILCCLFTGAFDQLKQNATKARIPFYGR